MLINYLALIKIMCIINTIDEIKLTHINDIGYRMYR